MNDQPVIAARTPTKVDLEKEEEYWFCTRGRSAHQPFCDGTHAKLPREQKASDSGPETGRAVPGSNRKVWYRVATVDELMERTSIVVTAGTTQIAVMVRTGRSKMNVPTRAVHSAKARWMKTAASLV